MIQFIKNRIWLSHLLIIVLLVSILVPLFGTSVIPEAEAAMVTDVDSTVSYYSTAYKGYQASTNKGGIIWVGTDLSYGKNGESGNSLAAYKKNPTAANLANIRMRFYTISEAFWFIHSGAGEPTKYQSAFQAADWVIIVTDKQVFNYSNDYSATPNNTSATIANSRLQAGYNYLYLGYDITLADDGSVVSDDTRICTYNIDGSYKYTGGSYTTKTNSYDDEGTWREYTSSSSNLTYAHSGTWYITNYYASSNDYTSTGSIHFAVGSPTYFSTGGPTHFSKIKFTSEHNVVFYGDRGLTIGEGVSTPKYTTSNKYLFSIYSGAADQANNADEASSIGSSKIVISSGNWRTVMAGGDRGSITGSSTLRITGTAQVYSNVTLGFNKAVGGNVNFYLDGDAKVAFLYASPRIYGSTGGTTNIHLIGGLVYNWLDVGMSAAVTMSNDINAYIYEGTKIFNMSPKWQQANLNGGDTTKVTRNLYLVGDQSFVTSGDYSSILNGFDNIYVQNSSTVNYTGAFKTTANLNVASDSTLYLADYSSDTNLDDKIGTLSKSGTIFYTLLMYVNGSYTLPTYNFSIIPLGTGTAYPDPFIVVVSQDGYSEETTWTTLAQAYEAARSAAVDCTFIVWGNTTQSTALTGKSYNNITNSVTITSDNNAVLTIPATSGFGNITILEDINIVLNTTAEATTASLYSGRNFTIKEGTEISTSTGVGWQLNTGWYEDACNYPIAIDVYTTNPQGISLGNPKFPTGANIDVKVSGDAQVGKVFFGRSTGSNGTYKSTFTINSSKAKVNSIYATPRDDDEDDGNIANISGDVIINLYNGSFYYDESTKLAPGVKCAVANTVLQGNVTINITDEFGYTDDTIFFKASEHPDGADKVHGTTDDQITGTITMNLAGWEGDEEFTQIDWLTYVDKLGAISTPAGYKTNVICREKLPDHIISDASDTSTYAVNVDAEKENAIYFHNDAYNYLKLTGTTSPATSGGTLVYGHDLSEIVASKDATSSAKGNIQYCSCSICSKYFADVANANAETQISDHNDDDVINIDDVYRYWYQVNFLTVTNDGGAGGTVSVTSVGADERNTMSAVSGIPSTYYSLSGWFTNEACSVSASSLGTASGTTFTPTTANVKSASGSKTGGEVTVYAYFTRNLGTLVIDRNAAFDETQVFVYKVDCDELVGPTLYVTVTGNGATTIVDVPQGSYTVTQLNDWSWRYNNRVDQTFTLVVDDTDTATFADTTYNTSWLDCNTSIAKK